MLIGRRARVASPSFLELLRIATGIALLRASPIAAQALDGSGPVPAVAGVLAAFDHASIVALADAHRNDALAEFRLQLIRDPAFATGRRDVVIEWANARYQSMLDRYVAGESVPLDTVRLAWRNTVGKMNGIFDSPVYEELVVAIRDANQRLTRDRRIRILACDPPIDWTSVRVAGDIAAFARDRDAFCASILEHEVLSRGRSALLILGAGHVVRSATSRDAPAGNVTRRLDARHPGAVFVVTIRRSRDSDELTRGWTAPSMLALKGTALGRDATELGPFETIADGFLFLRDGRDVEPDPSIYDDGPYRRELDRRSCMAQHRPFPATTSARAARASITVCP